MSNDPKANITYCGVYCGACSLRNAGQEQDHRHLTEKARKLDPEELQYWITCPGCKVGSHRADCDFRICATSKDLIHCVDCADFPCKLHVDFNNDGTPHRANSIASLTILKDKGEEAWLEFQEKKCTCSCGAQLSWYLQKCLKCGLPNEFAVNKVK